MHELIDSHCHLDFEVFNHDRSSVIARARAIGIKHIVVPGVSRHNWNSIREICARDPLLHPCYGLHPYLTAEHSDGDLAALRAWLDSNTCVAIGECGLDYRKNQADKQLQLKFFLAQLELAHTAARPVVIHAVHATEHVIRALKNYPGLHGMVHSYSGSYEQARQLVDLGFYISLGGAITYDRAAKLRSTASKLPLDFILLETDAPDQPDSSHSGQRNEPAYLVKVLECLGRLRDESVEQIAEQTTLNAKALFQI